MRTHYTYWFQDGFMWRAVKGGVFKPTEDILLMERDLAEKLLRIYAEGATRTDYFAKTAAELRDELAEAIGKYEQFNMRSVA
jgi:hypothetical protein